VTSPVPLGAVTEDVVGMTYHQQMVAQYVQASEQITLNAMVMLCLLARRFRADVKYVLLVDSDQGDWQEVGTLVSGLPEFPGHFTADLDIDRDDEFDDQGWAASIDDRTNHVWQLFAVTSEYLPGYLLLDVDKVLAEVVLPWRPATKQGQALTAQGLCGQATDWPNMPCALSGGHPGQHHPDYSVLDTRDYVAGDTADCAGCDGAVEFDGKHWWHSRIDDGSHDAAPAES